MSKSKSAHSSSDASNSGVDQTPESSHYASITGDAGSRDERQDEEPSVSIASIEQFANLHAFDGAHGDQQNRTPHHTVGADHQLSHQLANDRYASCLFEHFREMSPLFPFVPVLPQDTRETLAAERPMLLLAILTVASGHKRPLQVKYEKQYREELAMRTLIKPKKSLELLQSMLVYLAWFVILVTLTICD